MRLCRVLLCYTIILLFLSYAGFSAAKALTGGNYLTRNEPAVSLAKREAVAASANEDRHAFKSYQNRPKFKRHRSPYGIVYKDGKPIGILEPISRIYEYQTFQDETYPQSSFNKRDNADTPIGDDSYVKHDSDHLEADSVLRGFRMNPHFQDQPLLDVSNVEKSERKRDAKKADAKGDSKLSVIENNLKEIISDLNTISADDDDPTNLDGDSVDKREIVMEDEDLDNGANKIGLSKETHTKPFESSALVSGSVKEKKSADAQIGDESLKTPKVADYRSEGESFIRQKRQQASAAKQDDIVKGLEASGDLTVSGNKSPLASASAVEAENLKKGKGEDFEKRDKQTDDSEYEKRLQRNIQNKISEIKEQVKREIQALDSNEGDDKHQQDAKETKLKEAVNEKFDDISEPEQKSRKKRNLLDQDTDGIGLVQNTEPDALKQHIRQKRDIEDDLIDDVEEEHVEHMVKREAPPAKSLGFRPGKNPDAARGTAHEHPVVTRALATKNSKLTAAVAGGLDAEKLEKLVKESATLTESIKSERGVRYGEAGPGPHVEVELHGPAKKLERDDKLQHPEVNNAESVAAIAENHADSSDLVINSGRDAVVMKREAREKKSAEKKDKSFHNQASEQEEEAKTKFKEVEAASDNSPPSAESGNKHKFRAFEASTKTPTKSGANPMSQASTELEVHTDSPEPKLSDDETTSGDDKLEQDKDDRLKSDKQSESNVADEQLDKSSEDGDLSKRAIAVRQPTKVRQERRTQPLMSIDDMQILDSENNMRRRRRYVDEYDDYSPRDKRDYDAQNVRFRNYRGDEDEADDESDEFDDDNFDDRTANLVRKRAAQEADNYDDLDNEYDALANPADAGRMSKRNVNARDYVARMNEDAYDNSNYLYDANGRPLNRNKRQILENAAGEGNMAALHGGGPMIRHLAAIRGRNAHMDTARSRKGKGDQSVRTANAGSSEDASRNNQMISGLSDSDIFGALPQSYEGELTRFKRVKRDDPAG